MKKKYSEEFITRVLAEADSSTVAAVCEKHGVSPASFYIWKRRAKGTEKATVAGRGLEQENRVLREALGRALVEIEMLRSSQGSR